MKGLVRPFFPSGGVWGHAHPENFEIYSCSQMGFPAMWEEINISHKYLFTQLFCFSLSLCLPFFNQQHHVKNWKNVVNVSLM